MYERISCADLQITDVGIAASSHCGVKCEAHSITLGQAEECGLSPGCISASWVSCSESLPYFTCGLNAQRKIMQWSDFKLQYIVKFLTDAESINLLLLRHFAVWL